jgi:hypothetical protein
MSCSNWQIFSKSPFRSGDWNDEAADAELVNITWKTLENRDFGNPATLKHLRASNSFALTRDFQSFPLFIF